MRLGFIGTGSMGSILIDAFMKSRAIYAEDIAASNRTHHKLIRIAERYPGLRPMSNVETVRESDIIFICVKPLEFKNVIHEIRPHLTQSKILVSITSPVLIKHLEEQVPCKVAKIIPSITNFELSGASLCMYGQGITEDDRNQLEKLFAKISAPLLIEEEYARVTSDLSSCGPAFLCFFVEQFVNAAVLETGISHEQATRLASEMVLGTGQLLTTGGFTPESLQKRVCVPGGITAEGLKMMESSMDGMFQKMIQATHAKYAEDLEKVESMFYGSETTAE